MKKYHIHYNYTNNQLFSSHKPSNLIKLTNNGGTKSKNLQNLKLNKIKSFNFLIFYHHIWILKI